MVWGRPVGLLAALALFAGCAYAVRSTRPTAFYASANRPEPGYYCYDCHGYRCFDPYYDWCPYHGFVYRWERSPALVRIYRERYVALKSTDRRLGRLRYAEGYRATRRYREPVSYDVWLRERSEREPGARIRRSGPEQGAPVRGRRKRDPRDDDPSRPEGPRPRRI